jgi:hypothetical protein
MPVAHVLAVCLFPIAEGLFAKSHTGTITIVIVQLAVVHGAPGELDESALGDAPVPPVHVPAKPVGPADPEHTSPVASVHIPAQPVAGL